MFYVFSSYGFGYGLLPNVKVYQGQTFDYGWRRKLGLRFNTCKCCNHFCQITYLCFSESPNFINLKNSKSYKSTRISWLLTAPKCPKYPRCQILFHKKSSLLCRFLLEGLCSTLSEKGRTRYLLKWFLRASHIFKLILFSSKTWIYTL